MKWGLFNARSGVSLSAWQVIGTVRPWVAGDSQNRSKRGLHAEFVRAEFYAEWARSVSSMEQRVLEPLAQLIGVSIRAVALEVPSSVTSTRQRMRIPA
jgi:hypothetical protein